MLFDFIGMICIATLFCIFWKSNKEPKYEYKIAKEVETENDLVVFYEKERKQ